MNQPRMTSNIESGQESMYTSVGDLNRLDAVTMPDYPLVGETFVEHRPYYVHLSVTGRCNAKCTGCVNSNVTFNENDKSWLSLANDTHPQRDAKAILNLLERIDEKEVIISFYGGEPLLLPRKIEEVISCISAEEHDFDQLTEEQRDFLVKFIEMWEIVVNFEEEYEDKYYVPRGIKKKYNV